FGSRIVACKRARPGSFPNRRPRWLKRSSRVGAGLLRRPFACSLPKRIFRVKLCGRRNSASKGNPMNIQVAVLCDAATDENGKLNMLGAFDTIYTQQLPAVHPQCSIALRVTFGHQDEGQHKLRMNFVDADGRSIMPSIDIPLQFVLPG